MSPVRKTGRSHELKTWPEPYAAVVDGFKAFEIRKNDRAYAVGDSLVLKEWDPAPLHAERSYPPVGYTGRSIRCVVTYLASGGSWGLPSDVCVMSLGDFDMLTGDRTANAKEQDR